MPGIQPKKIQPKDSARSSCVWQQSSRKYQLVMKWDLLQYNLWLWWKGFRWKFAFVTQIPAPHRVNLKECTLLITYITRCMKEEHYWPAFRNNCTGLFIIITTKKVHSVIDKKPIEVLYNTYPDFYRRKLKCYIFIIKTYVLKLI